MLGDMQRDAEHRHADRDGGNRQQDLGRRLGAAEPALPGVEIRRRPVAERLRLVVSGGVVDARYARQNERQRDGDDNEAADDDEQIIGNAIAGE